MKPSILFKVIGVMLIASVFSGCQSVGVGEVADFQGKIFRGDVLVPIVTSPTPLPEKYWEQTGYVPNRDKNIRLAKVRTVTGSFYTAITRVSSFAIPDSIEVSQLGKGAIVDVISPRGDVANFGTRRINRIVRVICSGSDIECQKRERSSGRMREVVNENPDDDFAKFGNTYWRKLTQADIDLGK